MKARLIWMGVLFALISSSSVRAQDKLSFTLGWLIIGSHAGYYAALDNGLYKQQGLDVTIIPGKGSGNAVRVVGLGKSDFGLGDFGAMIIGRSKGLKNRLVAVIIGDAPYVFYSLEPNAVRTPKGIEGKKIATTKGNTGYVLFPAFAEMHNIDPSKVQWVIMNEGSLIPSVLTGKVDMVTLYTGSSPMIEAHAKKQGKKAVPLYYKDWGFKLYSDGLFATDDTLAKRPHVVRRFLAATLKGTVWAMEHENEAVAILRKHNEALNPETTLESWRIRAESMLTEEAKKRGLGYMTAEKVRSTRDLVAKYFHIEPAPPFEELYTNEFLPGIMPPKGR